MCEFKVFLDGRKVMEDVIFVKADGRRVTLKDVVGETRVFEDVRVVEVNVPATRLVLDGG
ncbi:MAG: CooT family nickel-binding protein [Candidatus Bathyarchaeia archaeon]